MANLRDLDLSIRFSDSPLRTSFTVFMREPQKRSAGSLQCIPVPLDWP